MQNVNPVKATKTYCEQKGGCGIQELNDTCFGIASAFNGNCNVWNVPEDQAHACEAMINEARYSLFGVGECDHQAPYRPLILNRDRLFPTLFSKSGNAIASLKQCQDRCVTNECKRDCYLDYLAVQPDKGVMAPGDLPYQDVKQSNLIISGVVLGIIAIIGTLYYSYVVRN